MNPLMAALRQKYGTPEKALEALGLPPTLLAADESGADPLVTALRRTPTKMAKLNATAARVHAALTAHLMPMLAADAQMPDLTPAVAGITRANLSKQKAAVWAKAKVIAKPVLAADQAGPDDVALAILNMIDQQGAGDPDPAASVDPMEVEADQTRDADPGAVTEPNAAPPAATPKPAAKPGEAEADPAMMKELIAALGGNEELAKKVYAMCTGAAKPEAAAPAPAAPGEAEDEEEVPMMKPAMDAAIKSATDKLRADMRADARAAQEARQVVRPWVGEVSIAFDSAPDIYKAALHALKVETKGIHPSAYRTLLEHLPKPGSRKAMAHDSVFGGGKRAKEPTSRATELTGRIQVMG